jgi:hypothetical protein
MGFCRKRIISHTPTTVQIASTLRSDPSKPGPVVARVEHVLQA